MSAIATPFTFILFYEVLTLIAALPASTTQSIANQFEVVSLIFIRDVFKDIAAASQDGWHHEQFHQALPLFLDMCSGLVMFLLVAIFQYVALKRVRRAGAAELSAGSKKFIAQKKLVVDRLNCASTFDGCLQSWNRHSAFLSVSHGRASHHPGAKCLFL